MKKIPSLFQRDRGLHLIWNQVTAGCEWVIDGEGIATRKFDGTCCLVRDGKLYKRYEAKVGSDGFYVKRPPDRFEPVTEVDPVTLKQQGWVPVGSGPEDQYHREAFQMAQIPDGTYELCGPKINGNPERLGRHALISHAVQRCPGCPRTFDGLQSFLARNDIEGIVFHHPDGRMAKVKGSDFGLKRGANV